MQQWGGKKCWIAFYFFGEILISTNQNLFSCKQISSFKPRVHRKSAENCGSKHDDQSNAGLLSGQQLQLDVESTNALLRVAEAQQQQECFVSSSQINDTVYAAPSDGNSSITATSPNLSLE